MEDIVKIPKERIAVLIGRKGEIKRGLEEKTNTKLTIDSQTGSVIIKGEAVDVYDTKPIIRAIARGFNPETAELLLDEENIVEVIDIKDFSGRSKKKMTRLKSRCIGKEGKARENIEIMTNTNISIYGKTISIIGDVENCELARKAIINLLNGSPHGNVYKWIQNRKRRVSLDISQSY